MNTIEDELYIIAEEAATEITEKANECCNRSDSYESDIKDFTLNKIKSIIDLVIDRCC